MAGKRMVQIGGATCLVCREKATGGWAIVICGKCLPVCEREEDIDRFIDDMSRAISKVTERYEARRARRHREVRDGR